MRNNMTYTPTATVSRFVAWTVTTLVGIKLEPAKVAERLDAFRESLNDGLARLLVNVDRWLSAGVDTIIRRATMPTVKPVAAPLEVVVALPVVADQTPPEVEATVSPPVTLKVSQNAPQERETPHLRIVKTYKTGRKRTLYVPAGDEVRDAYWYKVGRRWVERPVVYAVAA